MEKKFLAEQSKVKQLKLELEKSKTLESGPSKTASIKTEKTSIKAGIP